MDINQLNSNIKLSEIEKTKVINSVSTEKNNTNGNFSSFDSLKTTTKVGIVPFTTIKLDNTNISIENKKIIDNVLQNISSCSSDELKNAILALQKIINRSKFEELTEDEQIALMSLNINFQKNSDGSIVIYNLEEVKKSTRENDSERAFKLTQELAGNILNGLKNSPKVQGSKKITDEKEKELLDKFQENITKNNNANNELNYIKTVLEPKLEETYQEYLSLMKEAKQEAQEANNIDNEINKIKQIIDTGNGNQTLLNKLIELENQRFELVKSSNLKFQQVNTWYTENGSKLDSSQQETLGILVDSTNKLLQCQSLTYREWMIADAANKIYKHTKNLSPQEVDSFENNPKVKEDLFKIELYLLEKMTKEGIKYSDFTEEERKLMWERWFIAIKDNGNNTPEYFYFPPGVDKGIKVSIEDIKASYGDIKNIIKFKEITKQAKVCGEKVSLQFEQQKEKQEEQWGSWDIHKGNINEIENLHNKKYEKSKITETGEEKNIPINNGNDKSSSNSKISNALYYFSLDTDKEEYSVISYFYPEYEEKKEKKDYLENFEFEHIRKKDEQFWKEKKIIEEDFVNKMIDQANAGNSALGIHLAGLENMVKRHFRKKELGI